MKKMLQLAALMLTVLAVTVTQGCARGGEGTTFTSPVPTPTAAPQLLPPEEVLQRATEAMSQLTAIQEKRTAKVTFTDGQLLTESELDFQYVAPNKLRLDRKTYSPQEDSTITTSAILIGNTLYFKPGDGGWVKSTTSSSVRWPSKMYDFSDAYDVAQAGTETLDGELCQIAAFNWGGSAETGSLGWDWQVELYISTESYLIKKMERVGKRTHMFGTGEVGEWTHTDVTLYSDYNAPIVIEPPEGGDVPTATPVPLSHTPSANMPIP